VFKFTEYSNAELKLFEARLSKDHSIRITAQLLDRNMTYLSNLSDRFIDGQVDMNVDAERATRKLTASFFDIEREIGLDSGEDADAGLFFFDRLVRIIYGVYVPELTNRTEEERWVDVPVFTGPITSYQRTGGVLTIEASDKESLAGTVWKTLTIRKGTNKTLAIKAILKAAGENYFGDLYQTTGRLTKDLVLAPAPIPNSKQSGSVEPAVYWTVAEKLAAGVSLRLYVDGAGYVQLKPLNATTPVYTFNDAKTFEDLSFLQGEVLSSPQVTFSPESIVNIVRVSGKIPEATSSSRTTVAPTYTAVTPSGHPFHPNYLGRRVGGALVPAYYPEFIQDDSYTTVADCKTAAQRILTSRIKESISVSFECLPVPHLDPNDFCALRTVEPSIATSFRINSFTLPLNPNEPMTVGYNRLLSFKSVPKRRIRT
jgi:hypothetical protein